MESFGKDAQRTKTRPCVTAGERGWLQCLPSLPERRHAGRGGGGGVINYILSFGPGGGIWSDAWV